MPYDPTDPRTQLQPAVNDMAGVPRPARYRELHDASPVQRHDRGSTTWWTRSQAAVVGYTHAIEGDAWTCGAAGEHVLLVLDGARVSMAAATGTVGVDEPSVVIVPPGESTLSVQHAGTVVQLFAADTVPDVADACADAHEYALADRNVAPFAPWPDPPGGHRLRVYPLSAHPIQEGRLGRIFRCSTVMVNVLPADDAPRDPTKLSPHHHDDFEQISLQVHGDYVHHMRTPWTPDSTTWRDDEHRHCASPTIVVIPPGLIHTSQAVGDMHHWLIDVFVPPRADFSARPGWVLNADEYPLP